MLKRINQLDDWGYLIGIILVLTGGCAVRLIPYVSFQGNFLGDLDPYRYLRATRLILDQGRIPTLDTTVAPYGTPATFAVNRGYYLLMSQLALITNIDLVRLLGLSPIIFFIFFELSLYLFAYYSSGRESVALVTILLTAFTPGWWGLVYQISSNPLAENTSIALFPLVLSALLCFLRSRDRRYLTLSSFMLGISYSIHPATFMWTSILTFFFLIIYHHSEKKKLDFFFNFAYIFLCTFSIIVPFLLTTRLSDINGLSVAASYLTQLKNQYFILDINQLISELGVLQISLAVLGIFMLWDQFIEHNKLALSGLFSMSLITIAPSSGTLRELLGDIPASGLLLFSHRMVPYLSQFLYLFSAATIVEYSHLFQNIGWKRVFAVMITLILGLSVLTTINNARSFALQFGIDKNNDLLEWIRNNTQENETIIANSMDLNSWIRTMVNRPTVFSFSYEDLASEDMKERILLYDSVYTFKHNSSLTVELLRKYQVRYVVVVQEYIFVDPLNNAIVVGELPKETIADYINRLGERYSLTLMYSNLSDSHFVFRVDRRT